VGGGGTYEADVRVVAASNKPLAAEVEAGPLPRGPVRKGRGRDDQHPAACATAPATFRRWPVTCSAASPNSRDARPVDRRRRAGRADALRLAGQCPAAGQCAVPRRRAGQGRRADLRRFPQHRRAVQLQQARRRLHRRADEHVVGGGGAQFRAGA
jgi:hypothetical protein